MRLQKLLQMKRGDLIYCLAEENGAPFYVGRTNDFHRRWNEHRLNARLGATEVKYQRIRQLWAAGTDFEMVILDENPGHRFERFYHYLLGCEYDLANMKMGDKQGPSRILAEKINKKLREEKREFATAVEFLNEYDREVAEHKARQKAAKIQKKIRCDYDDTSRTLFIGDKPSEKFVSPALQAMRSRNAIKKSSRPGPTA